MLACSYNEFKSTGAATAFLGVPKRSSPNWIIAAVSRVVAVADLGLELAPAKIRSWTRQFDDLD